MVVKGEVSVESKKTGTFKAKVSSKVYAGDIVTTGIEGRAKIVMSDRNVLNISTDTKLTINKYENDSTTGVKNVDIDLSKGKLRSNVEQKYDGEKSQFLIKTPTAVAGVRGTQFLTSFDPATRKTEIVTFKGAVALSIPGSGAPPVMVKKGESSSVSQGQSVPEAPKPMKKEDLDQVNKNSNSAKSETPNESSTSTDVVGNNKKEESKRDDVKSDDVRKDEKKDQKRNVASDETAPKDKPKEPKMIDKKDMDTGMANSLPPPIVEGPSKPNIPQGPPPKPPGPPEIVNNPNSPSQGSSSPLLKTKVIVIPKVGN